MFEEDATLRLRTEGVGVLSREDALKLCVVGPVLRGSGVASDVRKDDPYAAYEEIPFNVISYKECDTWARLMVRADEVLESLDILEYALSSHSQMDDCGLGFNEKYLKAKQLAVLKPPEANSYIMLKVMEPHILTESKSEHQHWQTLWLFQMLYAVAYIADIPSVMGSLDPCFSCTDRMAFIDTKNGQKWHWSLDDVNNFKKPEGADLVWHLTWFLL